jgi:beta-glucosidase
VSAVADAPSGTDVYDSADCSGYCDAYGTSVATPIITAMYALAGTPKANTYPASYLYEDPSGLTPVTSGNDVMSGSPLTCESSREYLCSAAHSLSSPYQGYNGPAGLGTPNGNLTPFTESKTGDIVSVDNPGTYDVLQGVNVSLPAIKAYDSVSGQKLTYSASGMPKGLSINSSTGVISGKIVYVENDTIHVTAKDGTGASATVGFRIEASNSLTASYHAGSGYVPLDLLNSAGYSMCMNIPENESANGTPVNVWECISKDSNQSWLFQPEAAPGEVADAGLSQLGTMEIHGKCLNIVNNGTADGSKLQLWTCNGGANEQWEIVGGYGELYNPVSGRCLEDPSSSTANGKQLDIWTCNGGNNQNWLPPASPFDSAVSGKCINDGGNSSSNGAKIISYTCNGAGNEKLYVDTVDQYTLLVVNGKCLNATGNGTVNGTVIQLYSCANSSDDVYSANLWYLTAYGQLENAQAQKCLAIPNNSTANGTQLVLEDCYGEPGEIWAAS